MFTYCMTNHVSRKNALKIAHRVAKFQKFCFDKISYAQHLKQALKRIYAMIKRAEAATYTDTITNKTYTLSEIVEHVSAMREINEIITDKMKTFKIRVNMNNVTFDYIHDMNHEFCSYNVDRQYSLLTEEFINRKVLIAK